MVVGCSHNPLRAWNSDVAGEKDHLSLPKDLVLTYSEYS